MHLPNRTLLATSSATDVRTIKGTVHRSLSQPRSRTTLEMYPSAAPSPHRCESGQTHVVH